MIPWILFLGYLCAFGGALALVLVSAWNVSLISFSIQSLGMGIIAWQIAPLPMAITKIVVGWLAAALIAITLSREGAAQREETPLPFSSYFRAAMLLLVVSAILALLPDLGGIFRNPPTGILLITGLLMIFGLLQIGLSEHPLRVGLGLLTSLQGFELGYLWMEQSLLVIGLLATVNLAIVLSLIALHSFSLPPSKEDIRR